MRDVIESYPACVATRATVRFGKTKTRHIPSTLPYGRATATIRNSRTRHPLVGSPKLTDFEIESSEAFSRWKANALRAEVTGEETHHVIIWYPGHAFVLPSPAGDRKDDLVRTPKFEDLIQIDEDKALDLCTTCQDYRNAEHYGQVPPQVYSDLVYFESDCGGSSHRPCLTLKFQCEPICHKHQEWDGYLARRSADDAVVSRLVPLAEYPIPTVDTGS